jgi:hypothetical protein
MSTRQKVACPTVSIVLIGLGWLSFLTFTAGGDPPAGGQGGAAVTPAEQLAVAVDLRAHLQWIQAVDILREAAGRGAEDAASAAMAQARLGQYLVEKGDPVAGEQELLRVPQVFPDSVVAIRWSRVCLIDALSAQGRLDEARAAADDLFSQSHDDPQTRAWSRLKKAEIGCGLGEYVLVIPHRKQAVLA